MNDVLKQMAENTYNMNRNISRINRSVVVLSLSVGSMSEGMKIMTRDVNRMAAPMRIFPYSPK